MILFFGLFNQLCDVEVVFRFTFLLLFCKFNYFNKVFLIFFNVYYNYFEFIFKLKLSFEIIYFFRFLKILVQYLYEVFFFTFEIWCKDFFFFLKGLLSYNESY